MTKELIHQKVYIHAYVRAHTHTHTHTYTYANILKNIGSPKYFKQIMTDPY